MLAIAVSVLLSLMGLAALALALAALPWASETNAPRGTIAVPLGIAAACFFLVALVNLGG